MSQITLRVGTSAAEAEQFVALQRLVWGSDPLEVVPNHVTVTVLKNGGALLGAYDDEGPAETGGMVGAAFWWIGQDRRTPDGPLQLKICSHMAGVLPAWQGRGVGLLLKQKQRELVLAQGLTDWITWTYDPLQRVNGVLNIHRLGATCQRYYRNVYGIMQDQLNAGAPSDRFQVDWDLNSERVKTAIATPQPVQAEFSGQILPTTTTQAGLLMPVDQPLQLDGGPVAVPIPADINHIRRQDTAAGLAWRLYTRAVFEQAFAAGYLATDCLQLSNGQWYYVLTINS